MQKAERARTCTSCKFLGVPSLPSPDFHHVRFIGGRCRSIISSKPTWNTCMLGPREKSQVIKNNCDSSRLSRFYSLYPQSATQPYATLRQGNLASLGTMLNCMHRHMSLLGKTNNIEALKCKFGLVEQEVNSRGC